MKKTEEELGKVIRELVVLSIVDPLTGVYNQHYLQERLPVELERAKRYNHPLSLMMVHVDHLDLVNYKYGCEFGDLVLKECARIFKESTRKVDIICRSDEQEFIIILPETNMGNSSVVAERIRKIIQEYKFGTESGTVAITISVGISSFPENASSEKELITNADSAIGKAKEKDGNCVARYEA